MQFLDNRVRFLYPISWFIWERSCYNFGIKKNYFSFFQSYGYINILCHIFNFGTEQSTATCNFHCQETLTVITNTKIWQVVLLAYVRSVHHQLSHKPEVFSEVQYGFVDRVVWQLVLYQLQNFLELIDVLRVGLKWLVAFKHSYPDMVVQRVEVRRVRRCHV